MSRSTKPAPLAGSIVFPFENLYILRQSGEARVFGRATYSFDGKGGRAFIGLELESAAFGQPARSVRYGTPEWREVGRRLEMYHGDDIRQRINEALDNGGHMALFSESRPPVGDRRTVYQQSRAPFERLRQRPAWTMRAAVSTAAEAMALGLAVAGIMGVCLVCDQDPPHAIHKRVATLETGDAR